MGLLFGKKSKKKKAEMMQPKETTKWHEERSYIQNTSFRGHKKMHLTTYGYKPIEEGIKALAIPNEKFSICKSNLMGHDLNNLDGRTTFEKYIFDFKDAIISVRRFSFYPYEPDNQGLAFFIGENQVGSIFKPIESENAEGYEDRRSVFWNAFCTDSIESLHINIEGGPFKFYSPDEKKFVTINNDSWETSLYFKIKE